MNKLYAKIAAGAASVLLLGGLLTTSVLAGEEDPGTGAGIGIIGNGADSVNKIYITNTTNCTVGQSNTTAVTANVTVKADTGGNKASGNTGGDVSINTGDATATSSITVTGGDNTATNPCCCNSGCGTPTDVLIADNGADSENKVKIRNTKNSTIGQAGSTTLGATVKVKAKTGRNRARHNTGGTVDITTGNAISDSTIDVAGGSNTLNP